LPGGKEGRDRGEKEKGELGSLVALERGGEYSFLLTKRKEGNLAEGEQPAFSAKKKPTSGKKGGEGGKMAAPRIKKGKKKETLVYERRTPNNSEEKRGSNCHY